MSKHLFVVNPGAGGEDKADAVQARIDAYMKWRKLDYRIERTTGERQAVDFTREHTGDGAPWRVYACGGDGTLNEVAEAAAGRPHVAVTHYPCGMGNDFVKIFGPSAARFCELSELVDGTIRPLDLIAANNRYALNIASVGFDAKVAAEMHRFRRTARLSARRAYDLSVVYNIFRGIHRPYTVTIDGVRQPGERYTLMLAANGCYYGGGYNPVPEALPDDGQLDFLLANPVSAAGLARMIGRFSHGRHHELPSLFTYVRGHRMEIEFSGIEPVNIDGEIFHTNRVVFELAPVKINFIAPRGAVWPSDAMGDFGAFARESAYVREFL